MKVLLIDDEDDIRRVARFCMQRVGQMEVLEASSGVAGIEIAISEKPDAIILDMMMPDMDGPSTFRALRKNPMTADIPVIFLTATRTAQTDQEIIALGAKGILSKPFNPMTLPSEVTKILQE